MGFREPKEDSRTFYEQFSESQQTCNNWLIYHFMVFLSGIFPNWFCLLRYILVLAAPKEFKSF